jgi:hypothetical protein
MRCRSRKLIPATALPSALPCHAAKKIADVDALSAAAAAAITVQDIRNIEALAAQPGVLDVLARSLAPSIYGHRLIKRGLILLLLGGRCAADPLRTRAPPSLKRTCPPHSCTVLAPLPRCPTGSWPQEGGPARLSCLRFDSNTRLLAAAA